MTKQAINALPVQGFRVFQNSEDPSFAVLVIGAAGKRFNFLVPKDGLEAMAKHMVDAAIDLNQRAAGGKPADHVATDAATSDIIKI
ncbi:hypothetical protein NK718_12310 [Alsobacter sp. SYSU M60028]|uniref:Uncharacterized protein n=1 Tax=Alsobacter ponti TaxID=2962936 RepID=A0ABT1LCR8_9HYPH|nr:hypothetical protein [Alsobacter ponti]MCP8939301.1 hypothetical protein [Alsobacter ponti]